MVTIYSQPLCQPCNATYRTLDQHNVDYTIIDISADPEAREYVMSLGHRQTPVIVTPSGESFSGFRPDKLKALVA